MEEGSETADTDGDSNMDAGYYTGERPCPGAGKLLIRLLLI